jgi:hypothetical protein
MLELPTGYCIRTWTRRFHDPIGILPFFFLAFAQSHLRSICFCSANIGMLNFDCRDQNQWNSSFLVLELWTGYCIKQYVPRLLDKRWVSTTTIRCLAYFRCSWFFIYYCRRLICHKVNFVSWLTYFVTVADFQIDFKFSNYFFQSFYTLIS